MGGLAAFALYRLAAHSRQRLERERHGRRELPGSAVLHENRARAEAVVVPGDAHRREPVTHLECASHSRVRFQIGDLERGAPHPAVPLPHELDHGPAELLDARLRHPDAAVGAGVHHRPEVGLGPGALAGSDPPDFLPVRRGPMEDRHLAARLRYQRSAHQQVVARHRGPGAEAAFDHGARDPLGSAPGGVALRREDPHRAAAGVGARGPDHRRPVEYLERPPEPLGEPDTLRRLERPGVPPAAVGLATKRVHGPGGRVAVGLGRQREIAFEPQLDAELVARDSLRRHQLRGLAPRSVAAALERVHGAPRLFGLRGTHDHHVARHVHEGPESVPDRAVVGRQSGDLSPALAGVPIDVHGAGLAIALCPREQRLALRDAGGAAELRRCRTRESDGEDQCQQDALRHRSLPSWGFLRNRIPTLRIVSRSDGRPRGDPRSTSLPPAVALLHRHDMPPRASLASAISALRSG